MEDKSGVLWQELKAEGKSSPKAPESGREEASEESQGKVKKEEKSWKATAGSEAKSPRSSKEEAEEQKSS